MIKTTVVIVCILFAAINVYAQEDMMSLMVKQRIELKEKEEKIKIETEQLNVLKKEVEADIEKYTMLLQQIEKSLKEAEATGSKRLKHVAKAYEAMQPEDAATRLSGLDNKIAIQILLKMNSKKAGLVIGMMEQKKATVLTKELTKLKKE